MVRDARKGALLTMRIVSEYDAWGESNQCSDSDVYAAPSIGPGFSRLPSWT